MTLHIDLKKYTFYDACFRYDANRDSVRLNKGLNLYFNNGIDYDYKNRGKKIMMSLNSIGVSQVSSHI